ncbi:Het-C-domain-containing protein [Mycena olivaceomarginata]|nr:Het-C-domain-containing protein [Mycena olivaceomarginata]
MASQSFTTTLLLLALVLVLLPETVHAFGAGDIPDFAFLNDKAFRHGDIENILSTLAKSAGHAVASAHGGNLFGFAKSLVKAATSGPGGPKFTSGDIKKVYFGNWLRDYSQCMDIGGLSKLTAESLVLIVSVLGFMTFGFATEEFQVTAERLGVYLPVEHIDNPKGYAEKEGDARRYHPKLRPPVDPRELEIDSRTGMKNYMASENQGWDTSTAHIRRLYEAYRLLGTGLHTLEDLLAHSNWVEIALRKMGHSEVFCHVGDGTEIETPNGRAPPLVTGTFGGADFLHSLMGEATDKLSQASVTDLASKMNEAQDGDNSNVSTLKSLLSKLPIGGGSSKMDEGEQLHEEAKAYNFDPNNVAPPEVQQKLLQLLRLDSLVDQLSNALNAYVYTVIAPWVTPLLQQATSVLGEGSKAVINSEDQYEVFDNPRASDPSHSLLSKVNGNATSTSSGLTFLQDHFGLILNEPAGKIAILVVEHSVKLIVQAWSDNSDPQQAVDVILEAFHHPYYATGRSSIQNSMFEELERWIGGLEGDVARETIEALTKNEDLSEPGYGGCGHGAQPQRRPTQQGYGGEQQQEQQYGGETQSSYQAGGYSQGSGRNDNEYSGNDEYSRGSGRAESYGQSQTEEYGGSRRNERTESYGQTEEYSGSRRNDEYGSSRRNEENEGYESRRRRDEDNEDSYGSRAQRDESSGGYAPSYSQPEERYGNRTESSSYGGGNEYESRDESESYGRDRSSGPRSGYGRNEESEGNEYGGGARGSSGYGRSEEETYRSSGAYESAGRGSSGYGRSEEAYESSDRGASGYGRTEESEYGQQGYGRSEESEYEGSGRGGGGYEQERDETFGAERLNINEEDQGYEGQNLWKQQRVREQLLKDSEL